MMNLLEKYLYEFSQWEKTDVGADGLYGYEYLDCYFEEENSRLTDAVSKYDHFVMAGSMSSFHEVFDEMFEMMVHLYVDPDTRLKRVHNCAIERFGNRVLEGGDMFLSHMKFLDVIEVMSLTLPLI